MVRRNFLRFGKRNGGSLLAESDYPGQRHDSFFNNFDRDPIAEVIAGTGKKMKDQGSRTYAIFTNLGFIIFLLMIY